MKLRINSMFPSIMCSVLFTCFPCNVTSAQDHGGVKEPAIPVYVLSPYHEDSLSTAGEGAGQTSNQYLPGIIKKLDTLQQQIHLSSAESTVHFIWLYSLVALLGIMNIVQLFSGSRIRKELTQMKRLEHQKMLIAAESSAISEPSPVVQEPSTVPEPAVLPLPKRHRRTPTGKPRVKKRR